MELYLNDRNEFIDDITNKKYHEIKFTQNEEQANLIYKKLLREEREQKDDSFYQGYTLKHQEQLLKDSKIFQALKSLPKGGVLHVHNDCCMDVDWVVLHLLPQWFYWKTSQIKQFMEEIAYNNRTYYNYELNKFKSFDSPELAEFGYKNLYLEREESNNKMEHYKKIKELLFITEEERMRSNENIWQVFERKIIGLDTLTYRKDIFRRYLKQYLSNFIEDKVLYIEIRTELGVKKNLDGSLIPLDEEIQIIQSVIQELQEKEPYFKMKIIIECLKCLDLEEIEQHLKFAFQAKKQYPDLICGFDMIQEEDGNKSTLELIPIFLKMKDFQSEYGVELPLILHGIFQQLK